MKKLANPFDSFTAEHTPIDFAVCSWLAVKWLVPYMDCNNKSHVNLVVYCEKYSDLILNSGWELDDHISAKEAESIVELQRKIADTFQRIWNTTVVNELSSMAMKQSKAQSERASKPRKFDSVQQWERIAKRYWEAREKGQGYGNTAGLANECGVSQQTIRNIAKKYKPDSIAK